MLIENEAILKDQPLEYYQKLGFHYPTTTLQEVRGLIIGRGWDESENMPIGYNFTHYLKHDLFHLSEGPHWLWDNMWFDSDTILFTGKGTLLL